MIRDIYKAGETRYSNQDFYRKAGKSGIKLPAVSLGLWQNFGDTVPLERSRSILLHAFDCGINHFDLANNYGPSYGSAESTFGQVMASDLRPYRDEMLITTKAGYDMWPGPFGDGGSRKYLMASLDQSLLRMKLDYVDIFYSHRYDPSTPVEETMQALVDIVRSGKALYAGISNYPHDVAAEAYSYLESHDVHCLLHQCKLNIKDRQTEQAGLVEQAYRNGTGFIAFSPLAQGLLTNKYLHGIPEGSRAVRDASLKKSMITPELVEKLNVLDKLASERGQSLAQMSLAWLLHDSRVTSVIVGASSVAQLDNSLQAVADTEFSDAELSVIDNIF